MRLFRGFLSNVRYNLKHKPVIEEKNELTVQLDGQSLAASVSFVKVNNKIYDLVHTLIPEQLQGQGLGHIFAERIFDYLVAKNIHLKLTCEFLQHFYQKNTTKYKGFIIEDFPLEVPSSSP